MNKLQLISRSYFSRLESYWNSLRVISQRVLLLIAFTLYTLVFLFIVKRSFSSKLISGSQEKYSNIKPVRYLLNRQKIELESTSNTKIYESQSNR